MTYELAKELKDAGFPQFSGDLLWDSEKAEHYTVPTLSELIEACRTVEPVFELMTGSSGTHPTNYWYAGAGKHPGARVSGRKFNAGGHTPEEAVARLWLTLNKKV